MRHIGMFHDLSQVALLLVGIGDFRQLILRVVHLFPPQPECSAAVAGDDVFSTRCRQQVRNGCSGRSGFAIDDDLELTHGFSDQLECIEHSGQDHDGCAVLVIMEHRNIKFLFQLRFNLEASGRCDIFQVDAAKSR